MDRSAAHSKLVNDILLAVGADPEYRLWKQNTGVGRTLDGKRVQKFGVKGGADLSGIVRGSGKRLEIEVKTGTGSQSKQQERFMKMIRKYGGIYIVARSVEDAQEQLR